MSTRCELGADVVHALERGAPVVALETTLITHGLPHPEGLATALGLEQVVRDAGAIPATIGIMNGAIRVGLTRGELEQLATAPRVAKTNLSNLAAVLSSGEPGSTTVAATMFAAHTAGIRVFATGGIGGVHRDAGESGDVSSDLTALSKIPVAVICAGAKAILDLPRTVEMLETLGVPVYGFETDEFPAFYRRSTGLPVDCRFDSIALLATGVKRHFSLGMGTGVLIVNPVPATDEMASDLYERALCTALTEAAAQGVRGRAVTPFLLDRLWTVTGGESVRVNVALLRHNAHVAARLAIEGL